MRRHTVFAIVVMLLVVVSGLYSVPLRTKEAETVRVPVFEYDPSWPKPLPNNWTIGNIGALYIDSKEHVWVAQRPATTTGLFEQYGLEGLAECCFPAPPIMEFDQAGSVVQAWGPIHNRKGELVGIIFDGNIQSLSFDIAYTDAQARAVSVDSRGIVEALGSVYGAQALIAELRGK